jgi:hypothetical protein
MPEALFQETALRSRHFDIDLDALGSQIVPLAAFLPWGFGRWS